MKYRPFTKEEMSNRAALLPNNTAVEILLMCYIDTCSYAFTNRCGKLRLPKNNVCDMAGCIAFFKNIDPDVRRIVVFSGGLLRSIYGRFDDDEWLPMPFQGRSDPVSGKTPRPMVDLTTHLPPPR